MTKDESKMLFDLHMALVVRPQIEAAKRGEGPLAEYLRRVTGGKVMRLATDDEAAQVRRDHPPEGAK